MKASYRPSFGYELGTLAFCRHGRLELVGLWTAFLPPPVAGEGRGHLSASATTRDQPRPRSDPKEPLSARVFFFAVALVVFVVLGGRLFAATETTRASIPTLLLWIAVAAVADLLPVQVSDHVSLSMSLPVTLAAGMVMAPPIAGIIAFLAAVDPREFRHEISLARDLFNRSQVAVSVMLASYVFQALGGNVERWPLVIGIAMVSLAVDWAANTALVVVALMLLRGAPISTVFRDVHGDAPLEHILGYVCLGLLAVLLATVFGVAHAWGLIAALIPLTTARLMFMRSRQLGEASKRLEEKDRALLSTTKQALVERRDERLAVAGELHDEVLPPLFKVHLMGQVLRQDLSSGRLLDLDEDLPALLVATESAQSAIRGLVRGLRQSSLGPDGLNTTIELLAQHLEGAGSPPICLELDDVGGSSLSQLLVYQVAREAMTNAARYSRASSIFVRLASEDGFIRLVVADDGVGFDPTLVDQDSHFGLQLIVERLKASRGHVIIDSRLGEGTRVIAAVPAEILGDY